MLCTRSRGIGDRTRALVNTCVWNVLSVCKFYAAPTLLHFPLLQSPDPHAATAPSVTLGTLGPHPAAVCA